MRIALPALMALAALTLSSCAPHRQSTQEPAPPAGGALIAEGTVTALSTTHGNAYTSIKPDQYEPLNLQAGDLLHVTFADAAITMVVAQDYTDVPVGTPMAVLHREGLTFAIRDGNFSTTYGVGLGSCFIIRTAGRR